MRKTRQHIILVFCGLTLAITVHADTLTLKDGRVMQGTVVENTADAVVLDVNGIRMTVPTAQIAGIEMAGTALTVRLSDALDSGKTGQGQRLSAVLEGDLVAGAAVVAPRGSQVYGRVVESTAARRATGTARMVLELTEIRIDGRMYPIATSQYQVTGSNTAATTAGRTGRMAAIGGLVDGSSGARTGAKIGLGASLLTGGNNFQIKPGTLMDFQLRTPLQI